VEFTSYTLPREVRHQTLPYEGPGVDQRNFVTVQALVFASLAEPVWPISLDISRMIV